MDFSNPKRSLQMEVPVHRSTRHTVVFALAAICVATAPVFAQQPAPATKTLRMQSTWAASMTMQDSLRFFAERMDKLTGGQVKVEAMPAGQVVPAFEILDAAHKRVIDGGHAMAYYWVGKHRAATLFTATPAGPFGMDQIDYLGWIYEGGGLDMWWDLYQNQMKLSLVVYPILPISPQPLGWFKRPIKNLADFKGLKCRQAGIVGEVFQRMGMQTVNMPGGEIVAAAQRGVVDCAEWAGGVEDLRMGFHNVWKYHYTPGIHESAAVGELFINADVWKGLTPTQQEAVRSASSETFIRWWAKWQKQNADALRELQEKHGVRVLRTPPEILTAFLKAWDSMAEEEAAKNPFFKKVWDSQRAWASVVVPAKRFYNPPYSFAANHYFPEKRPELKGAEKK